MNVGEALLGDTLQNTPYHLLPPCTHQYKGGARYYGEIFDFKRQGRGVMTYPDGDFYEGHFEAGVKDGSGTQKWLDGSVYTGPFKQGRRHGTGIHQWPSGEVFEGEFVEDERCGKGSYIWPSGDRFEGDFGADLKNGPGTFHFANGDTFKGCYKDDERSGEGSMQYSTKTEDRGSWRGCSLVKLCNSVLPASLLDIESPSPGCDMCDLREVTKGFTVQGRPENALSMGALETSSQALLLAALKGDNAASVYLLQYTCARPDVADCNGLTPLHAASVFCRTKVVNILLDNGADVNQLTDAGVSPLVACHLHLYYNSQCGYNINTRKEPLFSSTMEDDLDGPIEQLANLEHKVTLPEEDGEESKGKKVEEVLDQSQSDISRVTSTMSEPNDGENYTTVVVYGKRYFVNETAVLGDLSLPSSLTLPSQEELRATIKLLLKRGADPKLGSVPVPALILAILAHDVEAVQLLLQSGADPTAPLGRKYGHKSPLHVAAGLTGPGAPVIVSLLLDRGANPNVRDALSFSRSGAIQWKLAEDKEENGNILGTTPLQVACSMDKDNTSSTEVIKLLLAHGGDTNVVCSGHSPLTLAIYSGNDSALDLLLENGANPSLRLGAPIGSALCAAVDTTCEGRRSNEQRLNVINLLMKQGGDIMALVPVGKSGKHQGTAVDYAMHVFYQDKRIAHTPFHALSPAERDIYMARTNLLNYMSTLLREEVQKRESEARAAAGDEDSKKKPKTLFKYCYECGRSAGVKLTQCTRCYTVSFCSQRCKLKAWTSRHRRECIKIENKQKSEKKDQPKLPPIAQKKTVKIEKEGKQEREEKKGAVGAGKGGSISKELFGNKAGKSGVKKETELIDHTLPRLVNLQHSQI